MLIAEFDTLVSGTNILPAIISQHRGNAVLVDFWLHGARALETRACGKCTKAAEYHRKM